MASEDFKNIYCYSYAKLKWGQLNYDRMFILAWTITLTCLHIKTKLPKFHCMTKNWSEGSYGTKWNVVQVCSYHSYIKRHIFKTCLHLKRIVLLLSKAIHVFLATMPFIYYFWYAQDFFFFLIRHDAKLVVFVIDSLPEALSQCITKPHTKKLILYNNLLRGLDKINQKLLSHFDGSQMSHCCCH